MTPRTARHPLIAALILGLLGSGVHALPPRPIEPSAVSSPSHPVSAIVPPVAPITVPIDKPTVPMIAPENAGGGSDSRSGVGWDLNDPEIKAAYKSWTIAFMNRETEKFAEHRKAFSETGSMSTVVFWVAQILLVWAIAAASIEFVRAQKMRTAATEMQEIRVSLEGLALKTSLHGTLLLVVAMVFYYLFLKFVYPITVVAA